MKKIRRYIVVAVLALCVLAVSQLLYNYIKQPDHEPSIATAALADGETDLQPLDEVFNILVIGTDDLTEGEEFGRSDAIMLASINPDEQGVKLVSILRDSYVDIPGHGGSRINEAYTLGGPALLMKTINHVFGLEIERYIQVDFNAFSNVIDSVGGVEIAVTAEETSHVFDKTCDAGVYTLNGQQALDYCRIRKIDNDFERTARQRNVLTTLYEEYRDAPETKLLGLIPDLYPYVETNMTLSDLITLYRQYRRMDDLSLEQSHIPLDSAFEEKSIYGQDILWLDLPANVDALHQLLYGADAVVPTIFHLPDIAEKDIQDPIWLQEQKRAAELAALREAEEEPDEIPGIIEVLPEDTKDDDEDSERADRQRDESDEEQADGDAEEDESGGRGTRSSEAGADSGGDVRERQSPSRQEQV